MNAMKHERILDSLAELQHLPSPYTVCLYGTGERGSVLYRIIRRYRPDITVAAFINTYKAGEFEGVPVVRPHEITSLDQQVDCIIIASTYWTEIEKTLATVVPHISVRRGDIEYLRLCDCTVPLIHERFSSDATISFTEEESDAFAPHAHTVYHMLATAEDKLLYEGLLARRGKKNGTTPAGTLRYAFPEQQYFEHLNTAVINTVIDAGVYDGRNMQQYLSRMPSLRAVYGFEPLYDGYRKGIYYDFLTAYPHLTVIPNGLWEKTATVCFEENEFCSRIIAAGERATENSIAVVSLDDFVAERAIKKIDFIKTDVEGAECALLKGAVTTLVKHRPQLALSLYHHKKDFFDIPLFLKEQLTDYTYHLGHYSPSHIETVLYALPNELCR